MELPFKPKYENGLYQGPLRRRMKLEFCGREVRTFCLAEDVLTAMQYQMNNKPYQPAQRNPSREQSGT